MFALLHHLRKDETMLDSIIWHTAAGENMKTITKNSGVSDILVMMSLRSARLFQKIQRGTGYSFRDRLCNFLHKFTWIVLSVHKTGYFLVNFWTIAEYQVKLWLIWKKFTTTYYYLIIINLYIKEATNSSDVFTNLFR